MSYEQYVHSTKPLRVSASLFAITLLLPIATLVIEGWHSGVAYGFGLALAVGFLIPGIYLLRPLALGLWISCSLVVSLFGIFAFEYYWRSVPDWMDAQIPHGVTAAISLSLFLVQASMFILGICGWVRYIRIKNADHANA